MSDPSVANLKLLSEMRLEDAFVLLRSGRHSAAYYLSGYAVECGFKAIIARSFQQGVIPDKRLVEKVYTHDLLQLVMLSGLKSQLDAHTKASTVFERNWFVVSDWREASRYAIIDPVSAGAMLNSVAEPNSGVLPWLKQYW